MDGFDFGFSPDGEIIVDSETHDIYKSKDVAKKFKVTEGCISQRIKIMIQFIRQDKDLCEMLSLLCE